MLIAVDRLDTRHLVNGRPDASATGPVINLVRSIGLKGTDLPETSRVEARVLCLFTLGFSVDVSELHSVIVPVRKTATTPKAVL